jgi:type II secretory pathway component GspD/PulD (secretin)
MRWNATCAIAIVMLLGLVGASTAVGDEEQAKPAESSGKAATPASEGKVLLECKVLRIALADTSRAGVQWNFDELQSNLGEAPQGKYVLDKKSGTMQIESLAIKDFSKFLKYLERFGVVEVLYSQSVSAVAEKGQTISIQDGQQVPYKTTYYDASGKSSSQSMNYISAGLSIRLRIDGISEGKVSLDYRTELNDATKSKDDMIDKQTLQFDGKTVVSDGLTLIIQSHRSREGRYTDYLFLIAPHLVK